MTCWRILLSGIFLSFRNWNPSLRRGPPSSSATSKQELSSWSHSHVRVYLNWFFVLRFRSGKTGRKKGMLVCYEKMVVLNICHVRPYSEVWVQRVYHTVYQKGQEPNLNFFSSELLFRSLSRASTYLKSSPTQRTPEITDLDLGAFFSASASKDTPGTSAFDSFPIGRHSLKYSPRKQISKLRILALASFLRDHLGHTFVPFLVDFH